MFGLSIERRHLKILSLILLVVQSTSLVTCIKYSKSVEMGDERYITTTVVLMMELLKLLINLSVIFVGCELSFKKMGKRLRLGVLEKKGEVLKLCVPSVLYLIQNNLLYFAISMLDAPTYQVTYNVKILTTALFSVFLLSRSISRLKWLCLLVLTIGVSAAQYSPGVVSKADVPETFFFFFSGPQLGLFAVLLAACTSGFAGVYFEKVLKSSPTSLWMRNLQLSCSSVPFAVLSVFVKDGQAVLENGMFFAYTPVVWSIVVKQALNGLLIAMVVKYADNIAKCFAAALSVITSSVIAYFFFGFVVTKYFVVGFVLVTVSAYVYSLPDKKLSELMYQYARKIKQRYPAESYAFAGANFLLFLFSRLIR